ncbi:proteasome subunit beta type-4-like [Cyclospora cayetanensis]|uniref:Proteasome subunit beta type-4-like n=1 Tax=Cyclospora cayetanensis TaxID=88456 RepID=A0A6P6S4E6_9EIME|nr:proteasome subunit beta type-4-like [Cyclospora cayetanensis]
MFSIDRLASAGAAQAGAPAAAGAASAMVGSPGKPADTRNPITTTSSVLAVTYRDGVLMVADTTVSYGRMVRFRGQPRFIALNNKTLICTSGEYSDHQFLERELNALVEEDAAHAEGSIGGITGGNNSGSTALTPLAIASFTARTLYNKRCRFNPYWLSVVVAGHMGCPKGIHERQAEQIPQKETYLGTMDLLGTFFQEEVVATGLGRYFAITLMREKHRSDMSEEEARKLLEECMRILFYRDCAASNEVQFAKVTAQGVTIDAPKKLDSNWHFEAYTKKTTDMDLAGCSW